MIKEAIEALKRAQIDFDKVLEDQKVFEADSTEVDFEEVQDIKCLFENSHNQEHDKDSYSYPYGGEIRIFLVDTGCIRLHDDPPRALQ